VLGAGLGSDNPVTKKESQGIRNSRKKKQAAGCGGGGGNKPGSPNPVFWGKNKKCDKLLGAKTGKNRGRAREMHNAANDGARKRKCATGKKNTRGKKTKIAGAPGDWGGGGGATQRAPLSGKIKHTQGLAKHPAGTLQEKWREKRKRGGLGKLQGPSARTVELNVGARHGQEMTRGGAIWR